METSNWPDPAQLTSYDAIVEAMHFYDKVEAQIDDKLNGILADAATLDALLAQFDKLVPTLSRVETDVRELAVRVDNTAQVAQRISGQVRRLDEEQSRVKESIDTLQAIQDLKTAISSISTDIEKEDWESATRHMQRALNIDPSIVASEFAQAVVPTTFSPHPPAQTLDEISQKLLVTFLEEFQKASQARDEANTSRYFKLFPMINRQNEGLDAYAEFVCGLVKSRQNRLQNANGKPASPHYFATMLTPLFEQIAVIISQHQPVVEKYYSRQAMHKVISRLQVEADTQSLAILSSWDEERRIDKLLSETRAHRFTLLSALSAVPSLNQSSSLSLPSHLRALNASLRGTMSHASDSQQADEEDPLADAKEVDQVIGEIAAFSARWQLFRRFIHSRLSLEPEREPPDLVSAETESNASLAIAEQSKFNQALQKHLDTAYAPLELWYLRIGIEKAHAIDEPDLEARPLLSSALDDVFFIVRKVLGRLFATANASILATLCKTMRTSIERDFAHIMRRRIEAAATALTQIQGRGEEREKREREAQTLFLVYLNDLDLGSDYMSRILSNYTSEQALQQAFYLEEERAQATAALIHLKKAEDVMKATVKAGMDQLFNQIVRPKIRPLVLECYKEVTYVLDEDGYADAEYTNYVSKRFARTWDTLVEPFRDGLTENNYRTFFSLAVAVLVRPWEATIKSMRFTELGALRFDRDLRAVISHLSEQTPFGTGALREAFTRLQQIATLLSADGDDVNELVASNGWRLAHTEMNSFLALKATWSGSLKRIIDAFYY